MKRTAVLFTRIFPTAERSAVLVPVNITLKEAHRLIDLYKPTATNYGDYTRYEIAPEIVLHIDN